MIMDDLMIMNDREANSGVKSWSSFGVLAAFSQNTFIWNCGFLASSAAVSPSRSGIPQMNNQFGGREGMIATNPSVLQGLDAGGTSWNLAVW
jgi:hypothetical protein